MAWRPERRRGTVLGTAAVLLSAAALWHGTGLTPRFFLTWLAPWPVLAFAFRSSVPVAATAAFLAWAGGGLNLWSYLRTLGVPLPVVLAAVALPALVFAAAVLLARRLARAGRGVLATLALPAAWVAFEHLSARVSPHGSFGSLAYTQLDLLPVVQVASVAGAAGIAFLLLLVPTALAVAVVPAAAGARGRIALVTGVAVALALSYGAWRLYATAPSAAALRVGLAAADAPPQPVPVGDAQGAAVVRQYAAAAQRLADADAIVLPETVVRASAADAMRVMQRLRGAGIRGVLVAGIDRQDAAGEQNVAIALGPGGDAAATYAKQHLLLPPESRYRPGDALVLVPLHSARAGLAVCKDLDFPPLARDYAARGAGLLLVPAWDFGVDGWLHSRMAVLRGVESGLAIARSARGGRLTLSDDRGRVLAEAVSASAPVATTIGGLRVGSGRTPYAALGDWFGWLCCALLALATIGACKGPHRSP